MGSKHRLLEWLHGIFSELNFETAADPFCGSGSVSYLLKSMGKTVYASDFLEFPVVFARAALANSNERLSVEEIASIASPGSPATRFISETFGGIFFDTEDLTFLDLAWERLAALDSESKRALTLTALIRSCVKKQPRGVFTVAGKLSNGRTRYEDGRRDLRLPLREHFLEQASLFNGLLFDNGRQSTACRREALAPPAEHADFVYLDPPYVPRSDDNCYIKRYHFLEGLATYWKDAHILASSKVKKLAKRHTPFSYRRSAIQAFDDLFQLYADSTIALSYSSNGYPDRQILEDLLRRYKRRVEVFEKPHRYHFGTHSRVERAVTTEYLLLGLDH